MSNFHSYEKVERLEKIECRGILEGECFIFEKLDGANAQVFFDEKSRKIVYASRNRVIGEISTIENVYPDNLESFRGFFDWVKTNSNKLLAFFNLHPDKILMGEWLVKHTVDYAPEKYNEFYIFDIYDYTNKTYIKFGALEWSVLNDLKFKIIPCDCVLINPKTEELIKCLELPSMCGSAFREGIVIKNWEFVNEYGNQPYAKLLNKDFNEVKGKNKNKVIDASETEQSIVDNYCTYYRVEKICNKIIINNNRERLEMSDVPRVLSTVWYDIITEEMNDILKKYRYPTINFKNLKKLCDETTKKHFISLLQRSNAI